MQHIGHHSAVGCLKRFFVRIANRRKYYILVINFYWSFIAYYRTVVAITLLYCYTAVQYARVRRALFLDFCLINKVANGSLFIHGGVHLN